MCASHEWLELALNYGAIRTGESNTAFALLRFLELETSCLSGIRKRRRRERASLGPRNNSAAVVSFEVRQHGEPGRTYLADENDPVCLGTRRYTVRKALEHSVV